MKIVPISEALNKRRAEMLLFLVQTKRDNLPLGSFFCDFDLPAPNIYLEMQKGSPRTDLLPLDYLQVGVVPISNRLGGGRM